jgi:hypothetical protein
MAKKMTMAKWERSAADAKKDKSEAKKHGVSQKKWEGSKADEKMDKAAVKKANKGRK